MPASLPRAEPRLASALALYLLLLWTPSASAAPGPDTMVVRPFARAETEPVPHRHDAADTPDIWVHPTDRARSLILGTDKHGGLMVYALDGHQLQIVSDGALPNDVSVLYGFVLGGRRVDIAVAGCRPDSAAGVKVWVIDPTADTLRDATAGDVIPVFAGTVPYGTCVYHSPRDDRCYFYVTNKQGHVEQYRLVDAGGGKITGVRVRAFNLSSICEGCVADNERGSFFLAEEKVGIWKLGAEPSAGPDRELIARVGEHALQADVEGLTLYYARGGRGYLIASSQGNSVFNVYSREDGHPYLLTIDPQEGAIGDVEHTDGIAATSCPTSREFPRGLFVAQDGQNKPANQNFKLYRWEDIAGSRLLVDTGWSPRAAESAPVAALQRWAGNAVPLVTESARVAPPGAIRLDLGYERAAELGRTESNVPFALDCAASRRLELIVEPVLYSNIRETGRRIAAGLGDLEFTAIVGTPSSEPRRTAIALAAEVKIPTAKAAPIGTGKVDYTGDLILTQSVAGAVAHLNLGYTFVGRPAGIRTKNVFSFALAAERDLARFGVVAELSGHTPAVATDADPDGTAGTRLSEVAGEELMGTLGARIRAGDRTVLSLGLSYDSDRGIHVRPGLSVKLR